MHVDIDNNNYKQLFMVCEFSSKLMSENPLIISDLMNILRFI